MTDIRSIHGIPANELPNRGSMFGGTKTYIPYLSMTRGEMRLALMLQQAQVYAAAYPENPEYRRGVSLLSNALNAGVSRGVSFVGALEGDFLQNVAAEISRASKMQLPASKQGFLGRESLGHGIHIGAPLIPYMDRLSECMKKAAGKPIEVAKCVTRAKIEQILNGGIDKSGHHMLYKNLKGSDNVPTEVTTKKIFQKSGVEGLAIAGTIDPSLMYDWVETAILQKNATGGVGPIGSRDTSFALGDRPAIGSVILITAITGLVVGALKGAAELLKQLRSEKSYAMAEAKGFGTSSISADTEDWTNGTATPGDNSNMLLIGGAALAAYLLTQD